MKKESHKATKVNTLNPIPKTSFLENNIFEIESPAVAFHKIPHFTDHFGVCSSTNSFPFKSP